MHGHASSKCFSHAWASNAQCSFYQNNVLNTAGPDQTMLGFLFENCSRDAIVQDVKIQTNLNNVILDFVH